MRIAALVPAYQAAASVEQVVHDLRRFWVDDAAGTITVVDDGSSDDTSQRARAAGATVVRHEVNLGKGAALRTGFAALRERGFDLAVTVDADGQHPAEEAWRLATADCEPAALVLGVRNLKAEGAPGANQISNRISNFFLSAFMRRPLADTQCGLRRYPIETTLSLRPQSTGYAFEAEVLLLAARASVPIVELPVHVIYDPHARVSHFHVVRDPARIIARVLVTLARRSR